jgi:hypothetical protein
LNGQRSVDMDRLEGLQEVFRGRAKRARSAAHAMEKNSPGAAALRGKAKAFTEASDALAAVLAGNPLPLVNPRLITDRGARLRERRRVERVREVTS